MDAGKMNYVGLLNEYAQKRGWTVKYDLVQTDGPDHLKKFTFRAVINNFTYPDGVGQNKKEAKQNAAKNAYNSLQNDNQVNIVLEGNGNGEEHPTIQNLSTSLQEANLSTHADTETTTPNGNYIGRLNELCQKSQQVPDYKLVERRGPAHDPEFVYMAVINKKEYPKGVGKSAKEAKQKAAQLAWCELNGSGLSSKFFSPFSKSESASDVSLSQRSSLNQSQSESIIFKSSSPGPEPQPLDVKPKRQLAANFQNSPVSSKKQSDINVLKMAKSSTKSTPRSNHSSIKFEEIFDSITPIGKGGFGDVYKARRKLEDTNFAVKIVTYNKKALREVKALYSLVHPNIVRYFTSWTEETRYSGGSSGTFSDSLSSSGSWFLYIQMEFYGDETLREWIKERNKNPEKYPERRKEASQIIKQVLEAVKYIHSEKHIHRDLKPSNILSGHDGVIKVADFGLVTKEEEEDERTKSRGTRIYMSPEQKDQSKYGRKVDIFPVGLVYFELLWCIATKNEKQEIWDDIRSRKFPKEFCKSFDVEHKLIDQMLCETPENRPDASDLLRELEQNSLATTASTKHKVHKEYSTY